MAIRIIKKGIVKCDKCEKEIAKVRTSEEVFRILIDEERFTEVLCIECFKQDSSN